MTSLDILEPSYCVDYSMQSSNDSKLPISSPRLPLPTQVISSPSCPPPLSYYENNPKAKDELIQKATARLRSRLLQEGLTDVQSKVSHLRSQLDNLRIELSTTENVLSKFGEPDDRQLQALERRFNTHQQQLDHVLSTSMLLLPMSTTSPTSKSSLSTKAITTSTSFSSTLSRMSSIFSSSLQRQKPAKKRVSDQVGVVPPVPELILTGCQYSDYSSTSTSSISEDDDNDMDTPSMQEAREKKIKRRQRVKQLRREYKQRLRFYDPAWNEDGDWQSARSPSIPSVDNHPLPLQSPPTSQQPHSTQQIEQQADITLSPTNETTTTTPSVINGKKPSTPPLLKETTAVTTATTPTVAKKIVTTSTASTQPKQAPAQCLCKRKSTNKPGPVRQHKAASATSQTYHSKQPEWVSLKNNKKKENHSPPPPPNKTAPWSLPVDHQTPTHHSTAISTDDTQPPSQSNVSGWLYDQQQLHLQQQQQQQQPHDDDSGRMDPPCAELDQQSTYRRTGSSTGSIPTTRSEQSGTQNQQQQQQQQALNAFDDVLRYLDTFSDFGSDTGLQQDISHLLSSFNSDDRQSTYSSSSSCWSHYQHHHSASFSQQLQLYTILVNHGMANFSQYIVECVNKGLSWCKFLSVLSLACLISLGRGPEHMLLSLDDLDYLDLLCGQQDDEFRVDSYYL